MEVFEKDDERRKTGVSDDELSEAEESEEHIYKVLGHDTFINLKKIQ